MKVRFRTKKLEASFEDDNLARREWGNEVGQAYVDRIPVLMAVPDIEHLRGWPRLHFHELKGSRVGQYVIRLSGRVRLVFSHDAEQDEILILGVEDYHE